MGRFRSMGRVAFALCEVMERMELEEWDVAYATAVQLYKAIKQYLIDQGSWRAAWPLTLLEDP